MIGLLVILIERLILLMDFRVRFHQSVNLDHFSTAVESSGKKPAPVAARIAQPRLGASGTLVMVKGRFDTSAWI